jgi:hypothetical protein
LNFRINLQDYIVFGQYPNGYGPNPMGTGSSQGPIGSSQEPIGSSQEPIGSGESSIEISKGETAGTSYSGRSGGGAISATEGTPGIPPGCPNPSGEQSMWRGPTTTRDRTGIWQFSRMVYRSTGSK